MREEAAVEAQTLQQRCEILEAELQASNTRHEEVSP